MTEDEESVYIDESVNLVGFMMEERDCNRMDACIGPPGLSLHLIDVLGISDHYGVIQFYMDTVVSGKGYGSFSRTDKISDYYNFTSNENIQLIVKRTPQKFLAYRVKQTYRRFGNQGMGGLSDIEEAFMRYALRDATPELKGMIDNVTVNVYEGPISIQQYNFFNPIFTNIEYGHKSDINSYFYIGR